MNRAPRNAILCPFYVFSRIDRLQKFTNAKAHAGLHALASLGVTFLREKIRDILYFAFAFVQSAIEISTVRA